MTDQKKLSAWQDPAFWFSIVALVTILGWLSYLKWSK